jgi:deoxyribodipyrimidine photo-lyase
MKTVIVWFRNDLRVHDHPALAAAATDADRVVPVFIFDKHLLHGGHGSSNRNRFLRESLEDLKHSLQQMGADLVVRSGDTITELRQLTTEVAAEAVYYTADYTPYAIHRDKKITAVLDGLDVRSFPGRLAVSSLQKLQTKSRSPHKVFTPFWKQWLDVQRRDLAAKLSHLQLPDNIAVGKMPTLADLSEEDKLSPQVLPGGERAARKHLKNFLKDKIDTYHQGNNDMALDNTSRLSPYLHFGCLSPREIETMLPDTAGARAWHRQLCWREFYHYVVLHFPKVNQEFQERYRQLKWVSDKDLLKAWQEGKTGYPVVDAAMRQLLQEGWMHNRARLIVGSFLTKDLWLDWRLGEAHFMHWLLDGDEANNNGNWQWIASVGVDPAPVYRRLYNPTLQQKNFDPRGNYVRRYVPELKNIPDKYLAEPWTMPPEIQKKAKCRIGIDYPKPIVDHKAARQAALEHYRNV